MAKYRKIKHYSHSYRARQRRRRNLLQLLLFLLILGALVLVGYSIAQSLGRLSQREESSLPESEPEVSSAVPVSSEPESSLPEYSLPEEEETELRALVMPLETMLSAEQRDAFLKSVDQSLYNTVVLPLKDQSGRVYYSSTLELAAYCGALTENPVDAAALAEEIEGYGLNAAALIYSLQDDYASHASYGTSYMYENQTSVTWLDNSPDQGGKSWMNPYLPAAVEYLSAMAAELQEAGFDDIFVFGNQYPSTANQRGMGLGETGGVSQADALQQVLDAMEETSGARLIPAYLGECYEEGVRSQIYTVSPNSFERTPSAPIVGTDLTVLDKVTGAAEDLVPVIGDAGLIDGLKERGIEQYLVR